MPERRSGIVWDGWTAGSGEEASGDGGGWTRQCVTHSRSRLAPSRGLAAVAGLACRGVASRSLGQSGLGRTGGGRRRLEKAERE